MKEESISILLSESIVNTLKMKSCFLLLFIVFISFFGYGEGTKQMLPDSTISEAGLYFDSYPGGVYTLFGIIDCPVNYRLCIHIKNAGESILFGLGRFGSYVISYNLRKPNGTIALTGICPYIVGQTGNINYYHQAIVGPFPSQGGYVPLEYHITSIADTGDYYFELFNVPYSQTPIFDYWDFQVVSGQHTPAIPADTINGRVWSSSWQMYASLAYSPFNAKFYVYSDDGIVTKLAFSEAHVGAVTIFCNPYGCLNTGNFNSDRQSKNSNTFTTFPAIAQYKVFLNNPDSTIYPSGVYGHITGTPSMTPDPNYPPCSGEKYIVVNVDKAGSVEVDISFPYGGSSTTVILYASVVPGTNDIPWNGLDGLGNPVPDGTLITVVVKYVNGLTNLPIWDQEQNPQGFIISLVRPANASGQVPLTYWDDTQLVPSGYGGSGDCYYPPQSANLTGCLPGSLPGYTGCHPWNPNGPDCHDKMINTWWYGSTSTASFTVLFFSSPPIAIGHSASRCGPGIDTIHATVLPGETVDWYATATGGTPIITGDTTFITPFINTTTTYYAEVRNDSSACLSLSRTPVIAAIFPLPVPTITGPVIACMLSTGNIYITEPGMSNYFWTVSSGGIITAGNGTNVITVAWNITGGQIVSVNYTNPDGCTAADPTLYNVTVISPPVPTIIGRDSLCINSDTMIYTTEIGMISYYWTISTGGIILGGQWTNQVQVIWNAIGIHWIGVTYTDMNGCAPLLPTVLNVNVNPLPDPAGPIQGTTPVCAGTNGVEYSVAPVSNALNYFWTLPFGATIVSGTGTHAIIVNFSADAISGDFTVYGTNLCGNGTPSLPFTVTVFHSPLAYAGPDTSICTGIPFTVTMASASNYNSILWVTNGGGVLTENATLTPTYTPVSGETGTVILTLTVTGNPPCGNDTSRMSLSITPEPAVSAGPDLTICNALPVTISGATATQYVSLLWTTTGMGSFNDPTLLHPLYTPGAGDIENGHVTLTFTATAENLCPSKTDTMTLTISKAPEANAGPDLSVCKAQPVTLSGSGASNEVSLVWSTSGTGYFDDPALLHPLYTPGPGDLINGQIILSLTASGTVPCQADTAKMVLTLNKPASVNAGPDDSVCQGTSFTVTGASAQNYLSLLWTHNGKGTLTGASTLTPSYYPGVGETGTLTLTLTAIPVLPCLADSGHMTLLISKAPVCDAGPDQDIDYGASTTLTGIAEGGSGSYEYNWEPASLLDRSASDHPVTVTMTGDATFILHVTDLLTGCSSSDSVLIRVKKHENEEDCIVIHNVITPNGDGVNDTWIIDCIEDFPYNNVEIFNRWGDKVNAFENYDNADRVWKGTDFKGELLPDGTYFYVLKIKNGGTKTGWVLIRGGRN